MNVCEYSHLPNVTHVLPRIDNAAKDENPKCWPACCRITRRGNGLVEVEGVEDLGKNDNVVNENVQGNVGNVIVNGNRFCPSHEMQKLEFELWNHATVGVGHAAYTNKFWLAIEPKSMQKVVQISGALTDEAVRNVTIKNVDKRGNVGEPSKDRNGRNDNKRTRTINAFATTVNPIGRENTGTWPKCTTCNSNQAPGRPCRTCYNCNRPGYLAKDCRSVPRNVNHANAKNPHVRACYECGSTDHVRPAYPRWNTVQGPGGSKFKWNSLYRLYHSKCGNHTSTRGACLNPSCSCEGVFLCANGFGPTHPLSKFIDSKPLQSTSPPGEDPLVVRNIIFYERPPGKTYTIKKENPYYIAKRIESVTKSDVMALPYGMLLTRLYEHVRTTHLYAISDIRHLVDHVMLPLTEGRALV
ncbi:putative reverse transcriptase domain-containing protein [Tanacetum coccineum]